MLFNSFGLGEMIIIFFNVILLLIPVLLVWLLFKTLRKISHQSEQVEQEVKKLREEIQSLQGKIPGDPSK